MGMNQLASQAMKDIQKQNNIQFEEVRNIEYVLHIAWYCFALHHISHNINDTIQGPSMLAFELFVRQFFGYCLWCHFFRLNKQNAMYLVSITIALQHYMCKILKYVKIIVLLFNFCSIICSNVLEAMEIGLSAIFNDVFLEQLPKGRHICKH